MSDQVKHPLWCSACLQRLVKCGPSVGVNRPFGALCIGVLLSGAKGMPESGLNGFAFVESN
jgi:hypothetical protein